MNHFYTRGGIVEPYFTSSSLKKSETLCYCLEIEPDRTWKLVCSYKKIMIKDRTTCCYYDEKLSAEPVPYEVSLIVDELMERKCYGFFVIDFLKIMQKSLKKCNQITEKSTRS